MRVERVQAPNPDQVAYRAGGHRLFAAIMTLIGVVFLGGTASRLVLDWPQYARQYALGIVFCFVFTAWAVAQAGVREVVLDRQAGRAFVATRWFGLRKSSSFDMRGAVEVRRQKVGGVEVPDSYLISLGKPDGTALEILEVSSADAKEIAAEIAHHLQLPVVYYVGDVKVSSDDLSQSGAGPG